MTDEFNTVSEDELHAYVDGHLSQPERKRIEAWLEKHPARAEEVRQWQAQAAALKSHFASYARSDERDRSLLATGRARARTGATSRRHILGRLAAGILIFAAGALTGLYAPAIIAPDRPLEIAQGPDTLPGQAQSAFLIYASEVRHPVEVGADEQAHLSTWLGKRLDYELRIPDLSALGFSLVGGRLVPVNGKAGAMLMYEDGTGQRLTVLLGRNTDNRETSFRIASQGGVETFYWIDGTIGYAVTGEVPRDLLQRVADECYRQFEGSSAS
ncbi:anti-sigma factor [Sinorhizobium sp. 8-89]|uniref:anti-sigma factor family protein n=1 Tax=Sinorhizobium sp. 7-81 TaxID=3049087 RepID=UPI0024C457CD|nr:anti-sigma factor [Sinorhizobium sp. 7-81]MDK1386932.1 anti-sigma factor [Sinorhizobium sp. 7-81]